MIRISALLMAVVLALGAFGGGAFAQINPFGGRAGFELDPTDLKLLEAASKKLYLGEKAELGAKELWTNPETGNKGRVALVKLFTHSFEGNDLTCRRIRHDIRLAKNDTPYRFIFDRCKMPSGEWKLL